MDNPYLAEFEKSLAGWTDERFVSRQQLSALARFSLYLVNLAEDDGWVYNGHSYKESEYMSCLVVKATLDDIPQVVFTNGKSYTSCVIVFLRKLESGTLEWRKDKYRS